MRLLRDLTEYREFIQELGIPSLDEQFAILRDLANIYLVPPENLRSLLEESTLTKMDIEDLHTYVKLRSDFKSDWLNKYI